MNLNRSELMTGAAAGASTLFFCGGWAAIPEVLCAVFWMLGGTYNKLWRRLGVPATIMAFIPERWLTLLSAAGMFGVLCIGYGIPEERMPNEDEGSVLGRFFYGLTPFDWQIPRRQKYATLMAHFAIGLLFGACLLDWRAPIFCAFWFAAASLL